MGSLGSIYVPAAAVTTMPDYLASIGKNSWYARFAAGVNMWSGATLNGTAATIVVPPANAGNGNVGSWGSDPANTLNFTAYWAYSGGLSNCPYYAVSNGINSLVGTGNDNGDARYLDLNSTTALNGNYSILVRHPVLARDNRTPYSHNGTAVYWGTSTGAGSILAGVGANGTTAADQVTWVLRNAPGTSSGNCIIGVSQTGTGHTGFAPRLFRRTTSYSITSISEIWLMPLLTAPELDGAMTYLAV
jgi:hypothetical protein